MVEVANLVKRVEIAGGVERDNPTRREPVSWSVLWEYERQGVKGAEEEEPQGTAASLWYQTTRYQLEDLLGRWEGAAG